MKLVLTTCGTSILTNYAEPAIVRLITDLANLAPAAFDRHDDAERVRAWFAERGREIEEADAERLKALSAEISGLMALEAESGRESGDQHLLLGTDTGIGQASLAIVEKALRRRGFAVTRIDAPGLNMGSLFSFQDGVTALLTSLYDQLGGFRQAGYRIVFNLTGGFKAVNGFLTAAGMFLADEVVFLFERSGELVRIPRLPIRLDEAAEAEMREHVAVFRKLATGSAPTETCRSLPGAFILDAGGECTLSPWGSLMWQTAREKIYGERLLDSPSERIVYSQKFIRSVASIAPDRLAIVNQRIDDLARHVDEPAYNPKRLDFKPLRGKSGLFECDAWADGAAKRIYMTKDADGRIVLEELGPHMPG